jgi:multimeric flavodoxin WrbA
LRLIAVNGSPHGSRGGTARILEWVLTACRDEGVETEVVNLADADLRHCEGCGACMNSGECPVDDGVEEIHTALEEAELVVFASPTYVMNVTGRMKTFVDRTAALFHRPPLDGRYGAVVTSSAGLGESEVVRYLGGALQFLGAAMVGAVWGTYRPPGRLWEPEAVRSRAERLGRELVAAAREGRAYPLTDEVIAWRRFLRELVGQNRKIFKADHVYWEDRGWYDNLPGTRRPRRES